MGCVCPGTLVASTSGLICFGHLEGPGLKGIHHIVNYMLIVYWALSMGISSVACAGAGISSLVIVRMFTTIGICGSGTPALVEY